MGLGATPRVLDQSHREAQMSQHGTKPPGSPVTGKAEAKGNAHPNLAKKEGPIMGGSSPVCPGKPPGPVGREERKGQILPGAMSYQPTPPSTPRSSCPAAPHLADLLLGIFFYVCTGDRTAIILTSTRFQGWIYSAPFRAAGAAGGAGQLPTPPGEDPATHLPPGSWPWDQQLWPHMPPSPLHPSEPSSPGGAVDSP